MTLKTFIKDTLFYKSSVSSKLSSISALKRLKQRETKIFTLIDVGASDARWTKDFVGVYQGSRSHMIEAQDEHKNSLDKYCQANTQASYVIAAAGDQTGEVWFDDSDLFGGLAQKSPSESAKRKVPMTTIDSEVEKNGLKGPFALKLDTHGFEVPILEGAKNTLPGCSLVIIETYNFNLTTESLLFFEICKYMEERGFRPIDISEPRWRGKDNCFWQFDIFFVPKTVSEFDSNEFG